MQNHHADLVTDLSGTSEWSVKIVDVERKYGLAIYYDDLPRVDRMLHFLLR